MLQPCHQFEVPQPAPLIHPKALQPRPMQKVALVPGHNGLELLLLSVEELQTTRGAAVQRPLEVGLPTPTTGALPRQVVDDPSELLEIQRCPEATKVAVLDHGNGAVA